MARKVVTVFGFSVITGSKSVVFGAQALLGRDDILLRRVSLGAQTPPPSSFLIDHVLDQTKPDAVILELATSGFNAFGTPEKLRMALRWMVYACQQRGIGVRLLNFPLNLKPGKENWVAQNIASFAKEQGIGLRQVPLQPHLLKDKVHVNATGHPVYAKIIAEEARLAVAEPGSGPQITITGPGRGFDPMSEFLPASALRLSDRYGLQLPAYDLPEGMRLKLRARAGTTLVGFVLATNRQTGRVRVYNETLEARVPITVMKPECYYEWPLLEMLPWPTQEATLETLPGIPDVKLVRGTAAEGPRMTPVLGVLWRTVPPHPEARGALHKPANVPPSPTLEAP